MNKYGINDVTEAFNQIDLAAKTDELKKSLDVKGKLGPAQLQDWHRKAIECIVLQGDDLKDVAERFGTSANYLSTIYRSTAGREYISKLLNRFDLKVVRAKVRELTDKAVRVLEEVLDSDDPDDKALRVKVAMDVLNRAGIAEPKEHKVVFEHIYAGIAKVIEDNSKVFEAVITPIEENDGDS